jgi:hypothetical protein
MLDNSAWRFYHGTKRKMETEMAGITRWDPMGEVVDLRETMDRLFDRGLAARGVW